MTKEDSRLVRQVYAGALQRDPEERDEYLDRACADADSARVLVFQGSEPDGAYPLKLLDMREPAQSQRLTEQHVENGGFLSPDSRWLACHSAANRRPLICVRPLAGDGPGVVLGWDREVSRLGANEPR